MDLRFRVSMLIYHKNKNNKDKNKKDKKWGCESECERGVCAHIRECNVRCVVVWYGCVVCCLFMWSVLCSYLIVIC